MKTLLLLSILSFSFNTFALPITCYSTEKVMGVPLVKIKINGERDYVDTSGRTWRNNIVGVTPAVGLRKVVYASGNFEGPNIGGTFIERDFVVGQITAKSVKDDGKYVGTAQLSNIQHNPVINITCEDAQ
ncbi:MAG: hypothetical protein K2P81_06685 [Bacteriovoracaceae bacterium]|nr:hypothetical protein [Bacteriovoracaceae bacterium]